MTFSNKLDELLKQVMAKLPNGSKRHRAYAEWIDRAQAIRKQRNDFVHGRWGIETQRNKVVNIIGLPTSDEQQVAEYEIGELAAVNDEIRSLQTELNRLREHWRL